MASMLRKFLNRVVNHPDTLQSKSPPPKNWSELPTDAQLLVCLNLHDIKDYIHFGAVCHSWRKTLRLCRKTLPSQPPMLLFDNTYWYTRSLAGFSSSIAEFSSANTDFPSAIFNNHLPESNLPLSKYKSHKCHGSTLGWLLTQSPSSKLLGEYHLVNPFLSHHKNISLPLIPTDSYVKKVVLSRNPMDKSDFMVMVCCGHDKLYVFKPWFKSWSLVYYNDEDSSSFHDSSFHDIIYYKDRLYAVTHNGKVVTFDVNSSTQPAATTVASSWYTPTDVNTHWSMYLVELHRDLICVVREFKDTDSLTRLTKGFRVFKLVKEENWVELKDLSGCALFLGKNSSLCFKPWDDCEYMANRIYFTEANRVYFEYPEKRLESQEMESVEAPKKETVEELEKPDMLDMGVFNVEAGRMEELETANFPAMNMYPIWVQPTLNMKDTDLDKSK